MRFTVITVFSLALCALFACQDNKQDHKPAAESNRSASGAQTTVPTAAAADTGVVILQNEAFYQMIQTDSSLYLIDVSTPLEYSRAHIPKAVNIDYLAKDFKQKMGRLDPDRPVALYCPTGIRSTEAAGKIKEMGFDRVYVLEYGYRSWRWPMIQQLDVKQEGKGSRQ